MFIVSFMKRVTEQLRTIVLTPFWTSDFSIWIWERPKTHHFHIFRILGRVNGPQPRYCWSLETPRYLSTINTTFRKWDFMNIIIEIRSVGNFRKGKHRTKSRIRLIKSWNLGYAINIFQKTWHDNLVKFWSQETKNQETKKTSKTIILLFSSTGIPAPLNIPTPIPAPDHSLIFESPDWKWPTQNATQCEWCIRGTHARVRDGFSSGWRWMRGRQAQHALRSHESWHKALWFHSPAHESALNKSRLTLSMALLKVVHVCFRFVLCA